MDISTGMLEQARSKNVYKSLSEFTIGDTENFP